MSVRPSDIDDPHTEPSSNGSPHGAIAASWRLTGPSEVTDALAAGDPEAAWLAWTKYLRRRDKPRPLAKLAPGKGSSLLWNLPDELHAPDADGEDLVELTQRLHATGLHAGNIKRRGESESLTDRLQVWLSEDIPLHDVRGAMTCVAWCYALPRLAEVLSARLWWNLLERLVRSSIDSSNVYLESQPLEHQLLAGELPLALAYLFPEIENCTELAPACAGRCPRVRPICWMAKGCPMPQTCLCSGRCWPVGRAANCSVNTWTTVVGAPTPKLNMNGRCCKW